MKSARIIFFSLLCFLCFGGSADARSNSVLSKEDGSLWIATNGQGLLRVGQHGHRIQYRHTEGRIPNDTILSVVADSLGGIWFQDIAGNLLTYSSTRGFSKLAIAPVLAFSYDGDKLWACTASELFSWKPGDNPQSVVDLPINVTEMLFSPDGRLWLLGNDALCRLDNDGQLNKWEHNGSISNLLPYTFEIDTYATVENGKGGISLWL